MYLLKMCSITQNHQKQTIANINWVSRITNTMSTAQPALDSSIHYPLQEENPHIRVERTEKDLFEESWSLLKVAGEVMIDRRCSAC